MKTKALLFVDFDGVINNHSAIRVNQEDHEKENYSDFGVPNVSIENIVPFTELLIECNRHDIKIVISSMWKHFGSGFCIKALSQVFPAMLVNKVVIGCTPNITDCGKLRSAEILDYVHEYCESNNIDSIPYKAVDDNTSIYHSEDIENILIRIDPKVGLTSKNVEEIISTVNDAVLLANIKNSEHKVYNFNKSKWDADKAIESSEVSISCKHLENSIDNLKYILKCTSENKITLNKQVRFEIGSSDFNTLVPCVTYHGTTSKETEGNVNNDLIVGICKLDQSNDRYDTDLRDMRLGSFVDSVEKYHNVKERFNIHNYIIKDLSYYPDLVGVKSNDKTYKIGQIYSTGDNTYIIIKLIEI